MPKIEEQGEKVKTRRGKEKEVHLEDCSDDDSCECNSDRSHDHHHRHGRDHNYLHAEMVAKSLADGVA